MYAIKYIYTYVYTYVYYGYMYTYMYIYIYTYITKITAFGQPPTLQFHAKFHNIYKIRNCNPMNLLGTLFTKYQAISSLISWTMGPSGPLEFLG